MAGHARKKASSKAAPSVCCCLSFAIARFVNGGTVAGMPKVYADDARVLSTASEDIDAAVQIAGCSASVTQPTRNVEKPKAWGAASCKWFQV